MNERKKVFGMRRDGKFTISFFDASVEALAAEWSRWGKETYFVHTSHCISGMDECETFLGDYTAEGERSVLVPTSNNWCAHIDNDLIAAIPFSMVISLAERLRTRAVGITSDDAAVFRRTRDPYAYMFCHYDGREPELRTRTIALVKDSGWEFSEYGEPLPFENIEAYRNRLKRLRLTPEMICDYAKALDIRLLDPDFYKTDNALAVARTMIPRSDEEVAKTIIKALLGD